MLARMTARTAHVSPEQMWNLDVVALFAALVGSRLLLVVVNWRDLMRHPLWMLGLATIHHPLLAAAGVLMGGLAALGYAKWRHMPLASTADALAAPLMVGLAMEQVGALLAGAGYGTETSMRWAVVYTHPLALRWSGAPLGIPVHPVQIYAALAYLTLALIVLVWLPVRRQPGDVAGVALLGAGFALFVTEFWRDPEGRGALFNGAVDAPQIAAVVMVVLGGLLLRERSRELSTQDPTGAVHE